MRYRPKAIGWSLLALLIVVNGGRPARIWAANRIAPPPFVPPIIEETFQDAQILETQRRFTEAYRLYNRLITHGELSPSVEAMVWYRLGRAQQKNHESKKAIASVSRAVKLDPANEDYRVLLAQLRGIRYQRKGETPSAYYGSWRNVGSARQLTQTNGVLHIFVCGRNSRPWTRRERLVAQAQVAEASTWLARKSAAYNVKQAPAFKHKYLILTDEVYWSKMKVPDYNIHPRLREEWMAGIPSRFGASSFNELFNKAFAAAMFDNKAIAFHAVKEGRAFALPVVCNSSMDVDWEEAFVHIEGDQIDTPTYPETYAHELLHLYGADDLYNKVPDPVIPYDDIMNCKFSRLEQSVVGSLTAYAIGWTSKPPKMTRLQIENPLRR